MTAALIDGKAIAASVRAEVKADVAKLILRTGVRPGLAVVLVGDDPASRIYVRNKEKAAEDVGFFSSRIDLPEKTEEHELLDALRRLNADPSIHGILVQLPLTRHIDTAKIIKAIDPAKDVDGLNPVNAGLLFTGCEGFIPCTPYGIMRMLDHLRVQLEGKQAVVVGRSNLVGKPVAMLLLSRNATVTLCHSKTRNLPSLVRGADIVIAAAGKPRMIRGGWIKSGAVVIDVGINRDEQGNLCGDVAFDEVIEVAGAVTPVPGGVGPMTIAMLLKNTYDAAVRLLK